MQAVSKAEFVEQQRKSAKGKQPILLCECGASVPIRFLYRCFYCDQWYCQDCAKIHFQKDQEPECQTQNRFQ